MDTEWKNEARVFRVWGMPTEGHIEEVHVR